MKSKNKCLVCLLLLCAAGAYANMIVNGSFETTGGWDQFRTYTYSQTYYSGPAISPASEHYFHSVGLTSPGTARQTVNVSGLGGAPYEFSAYVAGYSDGDTAILELEYYNSDGGSLGVDARLDGTTGGADGQTNTWDLFSAAGTVPVGAVSADVRILRGGSGNGNDNYVDLVSLNITPGPYAVITETGGSTTVTEGGPADTYTLSLGVEPSTDVIVTVTPADIQVDLGSGPGNDVTAVFTSGQGGNWATPRTITVTAVDDDVYEGKTAHETMITHTASGGEYQGITISPVAVDVFDNEQTCGDWGYFNTDLNRDCHVNLLDFAIFASYWTGL